MSMVKVIIDWTEGSNPRFVEVEDANGNSVQLPWEDLGNGLMALTLAVMDETA